MSDMERSLGETWGEEDVKMKKGMMNVVSSRNILNK